MKKHSFIIKKPLPLIAKFTLKGEFITKIELQQNTDNHFKCEIESEETNAGLNKLIENWLEGYCSKKSSLPHLPLFLEGISPFRRKVLKALQKVPFGEISDYSSLAKQAGSPNAYRAAGSSCANNPFPLVIPCHRILAKNGSLGGYFGGLDIKKLLLQFEAN